MNRRLVVSHLADCAARWLAASDHDEHVRDPQLAVADGTQDEDLTEICMDFLALHGLSTIETETLMQLRSGRPVDWSSV